MKIVIDKNKFMNALNAVKDIAVGNNNIQILQNVKMETTGDEEITLTTSCLDQTISSKVQCKVEERGIITVPAKLIAQMVGMLPLGMVTFSHDGNSAKAVLKGGEVNYKIAALPADDFPKEASVKGKAITFSQCELKDMIRKTWYASSQDGTRISIMSVCLQFSDGHACAIGTDGRRLGCCKVAKDGCPDGEVIIPTCSVKTIMRLIGTEGDVDVSIEEGVAAKFVTKEWILTTKLVADKYPNWRQVVPTSVANAIEVDRLVFAEAVKQVSLASSAINTNIGVCFGGNVMTLTAADEEMADAKVIIPVKYEGAEYKAFFNPRYILDVLGSLDDDAVSYNFNGASQPITITPKGEKTSDCTAVIMPLRVN